MTNSRNPTLDLLRSIAIIAVLNCHVGSVFGTDVTSRLFGLGGRGVDLFFALSGWLLGHQLFSELKRSGTIDVKRFWMRRWLRTLPAYYAVLALTYTWQILLRNNWHLDYSFVWFGQTYVSDIPYFGVSWSLCVEEHFYLFIAPLLLLLSRSKWSFMALACILAIPGVCRTFGWYGNLSQSHVRFDQCGVGVLLAYVCVFAPSLWSIACRFAVVAASVAILCIAANLIWRLNPDWQINDFGITAWALISGALVLLANSSQFWKSDLSVPFTRYIADRSYSLYLLHVEAIVIVKKVPGIDFWPALILTWVVSLILAECLYRLIERPVLSYREKWRGSRGVEFKSALPDTQSALPHCEGESLVL